MRLPSASLRHRHTAGPTGGASGVRIRKFYVGFDKCGMCSCNSGGRPVKGIFDDTENSNLSAARGAAGWNTLRALRVLD